MPVRAADESAEDFEARISQLCRSHTARLLAWLDNPQTAEPEPQARYDGTVGSLCRIYRLHPLSRFHRTKHTTRRFYAAYLDLIEATVGTRLVNRVDLFTVEHWYAQWRKPAAPGGDERIDRAHDAVSMFRTVVNFCAKLRFPGRKACQELAEDLEGVKFEKGGAREQEMTYGYVVAFIAAAEDLGRKGLVPAHRARGLAIGVTAQFELLLRQKDIIGEWAPKALARFPQGASLLEQGNEMWGGFFTWENIPGWRWRMKTSKSKYRAAADFDLTRYRLLMPLLEAVPHEEREGAIVKGEHGLPARESTYRKDFRAIARSAGIPDDVWSMDSRAGGATEAGESGATIDDIRGALTHASTGTTVRYIARRGETKKTANVAEARARARAEGAGKEKP
ncbi:MAG: hypothetical protein HXY30_17235 [Pseudorhodoplanes sp.]|nr:hypothetical protein [Pseudorhodoplanes sp.]